MSVTMASRGPAENQARPEVGDTLVVIHDFQARSSDELSLAKGDRVELIERDDEFGDGWFLGRHLVNNNTGLFPEVYTRQAPKSAVAPAPASPKPLPPLAEVKHDIDPASAGSISSKRASDSSTPPSAGQTTEISPSMPPTSSKLEMSPSVASPSVPSSGLGRLNNTSQDSQVLNETLNVINEHITDLRSPSANVVLQAPTDSGSEYSAPLDQRMSYIQGEETDEEEDQVHTRAEVEAWKPEDVAEFLFTAGVEKHHCEVFRDQEISGEVLLGMDQSSLFIKAFDLGSVGRRLKTWHKIKELQDEVNSQEMSTRKTSQTYDGEAASGDVRRTRSRNNTLTSPVLNRPVSVHTRRLSTSQTPKPPSAALPSPVSPQAARGSPTLAVHGGRPSAASIRELNHSRRHSSTDFRISGTNMGALVPALNTNRGSADADGKHKKHPSFDRNWTLGSAFSQSSPRPMSSAGPNDAMRGPDPDMLQDSAVDLDRGYFSGTEVDGRKRNLLRKRDGASHSKKSSYTEEQRVRSATALSRHSRFGSVDSFRDGPPSSAIQKYFAAQATPHRRTASTNTAESARPLPPAKDGPSPTVTHLEPGSGSGRSLPSPTAARHPGFHSDWLSTVVNKPLGKARPGKRAISDRLAGNRQKDAETAELPPKDLPLDSPARTASSTPSVGPSLDLDSPGTGKSSSTAATSVSKANKKKSKKETSAYTRGLLSISPVEAKDADYYGWMSKKSSNLMTTWKPRLFVLRGRRLAYYYSEDDDQEKGLIDISFHRVLPASNEKLTGLHATITGAVGGPSIPVATMPHGSGEPMGLEKGDDSPFIFKLIPPRAGLSRAVNFTKPTVHYFAVPNLNQGRLWMGALMKATIDRDDTQPISSTYQQKTISLAKAKQMRHRPPALMNLEEANEEDNKGRNVKKANGLGIFGESDSGVSGMDKLAGAKLDSAADGGDKCTTLPTPSA